MSAAIGDYITTYHHLDGNVRSTMTETALDCHTYRWVCYHVTRILAFLICDLLNHPIEVEIGDLEEMILLVMVSAF